MGAEHFAAVAAFVLVFGLVRETHLLPLVIGESLGVRRLGSILGLQALFTTFGFAAGPAIAGRIFDVTGSYSGAWVLFAAMALVSALAMSATLPLGEESTRIAVERLDAVISHSGARFEDQVEGGRERRRRTRGSHLGDD